MKQMAGSIGDRQQDGKVKSQHIQSMKDRIMYGVEEEVCTKRTRKYELETRQRWSERSVKQILCVVTVSWVGGKVKPALEYEED